MKKRPVLIATTLVGIGVALGVILVTAFTGNGISTLFAGGVSDIGAKNPPVQISEGVKMMNNAFVAASKAVSPTVVSINVVTERKSQPNDMQRFFRFFGDPRNQEDDGSGGGDDGTERGEGSGSGVIITGDGYIVTNNHVVEDAKTDGIKVTLQDKREFKAKLIGKDPQTDLAVIKIEGSDLPVAHIGKPDDIQLGEWVLAVGSPLGLRSTVTTGIISAIGRDGLNLNKGKYRIENFIQTDAAINPGNSGGGLFTLSGSLIGINSAIATRTGYYQGYGFAIPIDIVKEIVIDLINTGKVNRALIGVTIKTIDETDAKANKLSKVEGVLVQDVVKGSAAEKAGIEAGDVMLDLDGVPLTSSSQLQSLILRHRPKDKVRIRLSRDGKQISKDVILQSINNDDDVASNDKNLKGEQSDSDANSTQPASFESLGFTAAPLTEDAKSQNNVSSGVLVTKVQPYSEAQERGLSRGAVIVKADRKPIANPAQLKKILEAKKPGML